jgi:glutathione S-transferase
MITLYGLAISNYYNKVKFALLEKQIEFKEVFVIPSQEPEFLVKTPLGKIPFIETDNGYISESQAIIEYLDDAFPEHPLFPADAFERGKCRELIMHLEINIELIARRIYGEALFGRPTSQEVKDEVKTKVEAGLVGVTRILKLAPYALGEQFSIADIIAWPHLQLVAFTTQKIYGEDLVAKHIPGIETYTKLIESRPHAQIVSADRAVALAKFFEAN